MEQCGRSFIKTFQQCWKAYQWKLCTSESEVSDYLDVWSNWYLKDDRTIPPKQPQDLASGAGIVLVSLDTKNA